AGDDVTGASTFRLEEGLDTGPVYGSVTEAVRPDDTAGDLLTRLSVVGARPQPADGVSYAPKLSPADARVDWAAPALRVDRLVRACTPVPGAWSSLRG